MKNTLNRLLEFTDKCRDDMHEPDEQGISAEVYGEVFDNAFGDSPDYGELVVALSTEEGDEEGFNLATLNALARMAVWPNNDHARSQKFGRNAKTNKFKRRK